MGSRLGRRVIHFANLPLKLMLRPGVLRQDRPLRLQGRHPPLPRVHVRLLRRRGPHPQHGGEEAPPGPGGRRWRRRRARRRRGRGEAQDGGREGGILQGRLRQGGVREPREAGEEEEGSRHGERWSWKRGRREVSVERDASRHREICKEMTVSPKKKGIVLKQRFRKGSVQQRPKKVEA